MSAKRYSGSCERCRAKFKSAHLDQRFCSKSCAAKSHGMTGTRLYRIWHRMRDRCSRPEGDSPTGRYYGRGIRVCDEWQSFENFYQWAISNGYADHLQIDRIDNDGNYCPENCRWATCSQNLCNRPVRREVNTHIRYRGFQLHTHRNLAKPYQVILRVDGKKLIGPYYATPLEAALAYDELAHKHQGEFATLNFPERFRRKSAKASA